MSSKELRRVEVFSQVASGALRVIDAAAILPLSYRQTKRLWRRFRLQGPAGLQHRSAGRASHRAKPPTVREQVLRCVREKYAGNASEPCFGPTLAAEHLAEEDGLHIHPETLRRWMLEERLWTRQRDRRAHRKRRPRKEHFGELVQLDGSFHHWFEQRGPQGCLMNMVDDATGITQAHLGKQETLWAAVAVLRGWIAQHGLPLALYTDLRKLYKVEPTPKQELRGEEPLTQFGRMCAQLGIRIVAAHSPQAKGRVERKNGVHQDRLVKKLRRKGIATDEQANAFLQSEYLPGLNQRFAKTPARPENYHRTAPSTEELDAIFRLQSERWVSNDWVVRHHGRLLQLLPAGRAFGPQKAKAVVYESEQGQVEVHYRGEAVAFTEIFALPAAPRSETVHVRRWRAYARPGREHPFKRHAPEQIKARRRQLLAKAAAARAGLRASVPLVAAETASPSSTPAPTPATPDDHNESKEGTFLTR